MGTRRRSTTTRTRTRTRERANERAKNDMALSTTMARDADSFFRDVFRDADDWFSNFHLAPGMGNPWMPLAQRTPGASGALAPLASGLRVIPVDVLEDEKSYVLRADLPGMKKEDVNV